MPYNFFQSRSEVQMQPTSVVDVYHAFLQLGPELLATQTLIKICNYLPPNANSHNIFHTPIFSPNSCVKAVLLVDDICKRKLRLVA